MSIHPCRARAVVLLAIVAAGCHPYSGPGAPPEVSPPAAPSPSPAQVYGCGLPRGAGDGVDCPREEAHFEDAVVSSINQARFEHPDLFRGDAVTDVDRYLSAVVENLRKRGFCAFNDGEEIAVKNSNDFSEQYDIITAAGNSWIKYNATCRPAWSAIPPAGDGS